MYIIYLTSVGATSLAAESRGCSLVAMLGLLTAVAPLAAEHGLWAHELQRLWYTGLPAPRHPTCLHWQADS